MVTSPYEWKILEWDDEQTNKTTLNQRIKNIKYIAHDCLYNIDHKPKFIPFLDGNTPHSLYRNDDNQEHELGLSFERVTTLHEYYNVHKK